MISKDTKWTKGTIHRFAGTGIAGYCGDGKKADTAQLNGPAGVFVDGSGNIFIADFLNHRIRKIDARTGIINTIAGNGDSGYNGDGINACEATLNYPAGVVVDSMGNVYFNDYKNNRIRKICTSGIVSTYAGTGIQGYSGDGELADTAQINEVYGLAIDRQDNIYIIDSLNFAVRKVDAKSRIITTIIGKGEPGPIHEFSSISSSFLGGPIHNKETIGMEKVPHAIEVDSNGNLFIGDTGSHRIRMVDIEQDLVYSIAGIGEKGYSGDNGSALNASLGVYGLRMDSESNLYFVDFHNHVIRVIRF